MTDFQPSNPTKERLARRRRGLLITAAFLVVAQGLRILGSAGSASSGLLQFGGLVLVGLLMVPVMLWLQRRNGRALAQDHPDALFAGVATIYTEQVAAVPQLGASMARRRRRWLRWLTQGSGGVDGTLIIRRDQLTWAPLRLARWFHTDGWSLPRDEVRHVELNDPPALVKGPGVVVTLTLADGVAVDLTLRDRDAFVGAWDQAAS